MSNLDLDSLVQVFTQSHVDAVSRPPSHSSWTHVGVAAVAAAVSKRLLERLRSANGEAFRERTIEALIELGDLSSRGGRS